MLEKIGKYLEKFVEIVGTCATITLFVFMVAQVIMRYVFRFSPVFTEELGRMLLIWGVLAGSAISVRTGSHISVEFIVDILPARVRTVWIAVRNSLCFLLFLMLVFYGIDMVSFGHMQKTSGLQIRLSYFYVGLPLFFGFACLFVIVRFFERKKP